MVLLAIRVREPIWSKRNASIKLRSDKTSALTLATKRKCVGRSNFSAREVAMIYGETSFQPRCVERHPGVVNTVADALSRLSGPNVKYKIPQQLSHVQPTPVPVRSERLCATLDIA